MSRVYNVDVFEGTTLTDEQHGFEAVRIDILNKLETSIDTKVNNL